MKTRVIRSLIFLLFSISAGNRSLAQDGTLDHGRIPINKDLLFTWEMRLEPATPAMDSKTITSGSWSAASRSLSLETHDGTRTIYPVIPPGGVVRFVADNTNRTYVGYQAVVVPESGKDTYQITFSDSPLRFTLIPSRSDAINLNPLTRLPTPGWANANAITGVRTGQVISLPLFANSMTGQKIVDYVSIERGRDASATPAVSQNPQTGSISGEVRDSNGALLQGVEVVLSNPYMIGGGHDMVTNEDGAYEFRLLPPGSYQLRFRYKNFKAASLNKVGVHAGVATTINMTLEP